MAHVLARMKGVSAADIKQRLTADAPEHATQGLYLEHVWENADDASQVFFLFRADDIARVRRFIEGKHEEARRKDPDANLPTMTYLEGR